LSNGLYAGFSKITAFVHGTRKLFYKYVLKVCIENLEKNELSNKCFRKKKNVITT